MTENLIIGVITLLICIIIQSIAIVLSFRELIMFEKRNDINNISFVKTILILAFSTLVIFIGNIIQISIWALIFYEFNEFSIFSEAFYHSTVNFSTLGYGDIVMSDDRKLLGALEAVNGVIMFGLSTGFLYAVLNFLFGKWLQKFKGKIIKS